MLTFDLILPEILCSYDLYSKILKVTCNCHTLIVVQINSMLGSSLNYQGVKTGSELGKQQTIPFIILDK